MNQNKKLLYAVVVGIMVNSGYIFGNPYEKAYHINWSHKSKIHHYCYDRRYRHDEDCINMHNYIIARAIAGRITNDKTSQEKKLTQTKEMLATIEATFKDNFLTEIELDARKKILLKQQEAIEGRLADIPAVEKRMTEDDFSKIVNNIMTKADITSDRDVERELGFMVKILKEADAAEVDIFSIY